MSQDDVDRKHACAVGTRGGTVRLREIGTPLIGTILIRASVSSQKYRNSRPWVLVALTVCFTFPVLYRVSAESRASEGAL